MKFSCERCGKKYATADDPVPGRVYKLKCKACGHLIVVKASAAGARPVPTPPPVKAEARAAPPELAGAAPGLVGTPPSDVQAPPEVPLEIGAPEPERPSNGAGRSASLDATTEISMPSLTPPPFPPLPAELPPPPEPEPPPAPNASSPEAGYVDLFADTGSSGAAPLPKPDDPFLAAARASLPDNYGSGTPGAPDPFAPLREELAEAAARTPVPAHTPPPAVPKIPVIPKPPQQKSGLPIALIGGGVAVLVGILAFVLLSSGKKAPPPAAPPPIQVVQAPAPPSPPQLAPAAPEPVAAPAPPAETKPPPAEAKPVPAAKRSSDDERRAREEKKRRDREEAKQREAQARAEKEARAREAREAKERDRAERERRASEERAARDRERERREAERVAAANMSEPEGGLTQAQIERVLQSTKKAFDGCIQAAQGSDVKLDGRRVMLRLNIQNTGAVTYPTLDDVTLNSTEVGSCLKSAARLMVFPKFKGDTMHVEVPLVMR